MSWRAGILIAPAVRAAIARYAVPTGTPWRWQCETCETALQARALWPAGRCSGCAQALGAPPYAVEVALLVAVAAVLAAGRPPLETLALLWWAACGITLSFVDAAVRRLPDRLTGAAALGVMALLSTAAYVEGEGHRLVRAALIGLGGGMAFGALSLLLGRRGPGLGDAKLAVSVLAALGWIGWGAVAAGFVLAVVGQAAWAAWLLLTGRAERTTYLPLGPFLTGGALVAIACWG
jgi:leader peptidase (prepilin peptidase)/N-methyltransferase